MTDHEEALAYLQGELTSEQRSAFEERLTRLPETRDTLAQSREVLDLLQASSDEAIAGSVMRHIAQAIMGKGSDIHVVPEADETIVFVRVAGQLTEIDRLPRTQHTAYADRWKTLAGCPLTQRRTSQEGRFEIVVEQGHFHLRVQTLPTIYGERLTVLLLNRDGLIPDLDRLGLPTEQLTLLQGFAKRPRGLLLVTGPEGSGKTTLLHALLRERAQTGGENVLLIQETADAVFPGIAQVALSQTEGQSASDILRAIYRGADPDVVCIEPLPDAETAQRAVTLAATGHLVLLQMEAGSALAAIDRLRELGVRPALIAQTLIGVTNQRLLRRQNPDDSLAYDPAPEMLDRAGLSATEDGPFRRADAYRGRLQLMEVLELTDPLRLQLADGATGDALWPETFGSTGQSLWDAARACVRRGETTVEEIVWALMDYPLPPVSPVLTLPTETAPGHK